MKSYFNITNDTNIIIYYTSTGERKKIVISGGRYESDSLNEEIKTQLFKNGDALKWFLPIEISFNHEILDLKIKKGFKRIFKSEKVLNSMLGFEEQ